VCPAFIENRKAQRDDVRGISCVAGLLRERRRRLHQPSPIFRGRHVAGRHGCYPLLIARSTRALGAQRWRSTRGTPSWSGDSVALKTRRARIETEGVHCDVRELVNPTRCERACDGIETRTSPQRARRRIRRTVS